MTIEATAELAGVHPRHLQKIEAGRVNVTLLTVAWLGVALGVPTRELFNDSS